MSEPTAREIAERMLKRIAEWRAEVVEAASDPDWDVAGGVAFKHEEVGLVARALIEAEERLIRLETWAQIHGIPSLSPDEEDG